MSPLGSSNYEKTCKTCKKTSDCFFILLSLSINFSEGRKAKQEAISVHSQLVKQVFLQHKITKCPNNHSISQDICTLFPGYLYATLSS